MKRLPKYKTDPKAAYNYARKNGPFPEIEEKVFLSNIQVAIDYAINIKKSKLCDLLESRMYEKIIKDVKNSDEDQHELILNDFFKYIKMTKKIPKKILEQFLSFVTPEVYVIFAKALNFRLSKEHEQKMFKKCVEEDNLWPITDYQYVIKKLPDYMHNFMIAKSFDEKSTSNKNAVFAYFVGLKNLKKTLEKLYDSFENKDIKLREAIDQL